MDKKISIIVPVYNVYEYLTKCLQSIQQQSYENIEVIMVNDGSTDKSESICKMFAETDKRFSLYSKVNGGLSSARNYGLTLASGEFVCFVDSDDWISSNYIFSFVRNITDEIDVIIAKYILYDQSVNAEYVPYATQKINKLYIGEEKEYEIVEKLIFDAENKEFEIRDTLMPVWKNIYRRSFLNTNNLKFISEREVYSEDYLFNMQVYSLANKVLVIDSAEYIHRVAKGSLSQKYRSNMFEMGIKRHQYEFDYLMKIYGNKLAENTNQKLPSLIAYSLFKETQCKYKEAVKNASRIISSDFSKRVFHSYKTRPMAKRNKLLYFFARHRMASMVVIISKMLCLFEQPYRYYQFISRR